MSPRYLWKVFEAGKLKMLVSGRGRRGKLQACPFLTLSFRPEFHHRFRPCIIWSYLIHWRWQEFGRNILCWWFSWWSLEVRPREFVDDDDFLGDCFKWGQGGNVCSQTWDDCASNPFGSNPLWNCISHNISAKCKRYFEPTASTPGNRKKREDVFKSIFKSSSIHWGI